jgi:hypothetical protein
MNKNIKKIILVWLILSLVSFKSILAQEVIEGLPPPEEPVVTENTPKPLSMLININISDGDNNLNLDDVPVVTGTVSILDSDGATHEIDAQSVLAVLYYLDKNSSDFKVGELVYYSSFNALYLRCMSIKGSEKCNNWLYKVDGESPSKGMDNFILSGGESVDIYFSSFWDWGGDGEETESIADANEDKEEKSKLHESSGGVSGFQPKQEAVSMVEAVTLAPAEPLVPVYIAFPEFYTQEKNLLVEISAPTDEVATKQSTNFTKMNLLATATESDTNTGPLMLVLIGLAALGLVAILRN